MMIMQYYQYYFKLVFSRDGGAQDLAKALDEGSAQEGKDLDSDESDDMWLAPGRAWNVERESHVSSSFIFEPALPLGCIVTKIRGGRVLVLGDFYSWEVLEMLVRFTALFFIYAFCVFFLLGIVFEDRNSTPSSVTFLLLATKTQDNLSFYSAFLFQIIFLYVSIVLLRKARRLVRASALDELLPVKGFLICLGYHRGGVGSFFGKSLASALSQAQIPKELSIAIMYSKRTMALTFEKSVSRPGSLCGVRKFSRTMLPSFAPRSYGRRGSPVSTWCW